MSEFKEKSQIKLNTGEDRLVEAAEPTKELPPADYKSLAASSTRKTKGNADNAGSKRPPKAAKQVDPVWSIEWWRDHTSLIVTTVISLVLLVVTMLQIGLGEAGDDLLAKGKKDQAIEAYYHQLAQDPKDGKPYDRLARIYFVDEDYARALDCASRAMQDPLYRSTTMYALKGFCLEHLGRPAEAVSEFRNGADARLIRAESHRRLGLLEKFFEHRDTQWDPTQISYAKGLAEVRAIDALMKAGNVEAAQSAADQALKTHDDFFSQDYNRRKLFIATKRYKELIALDNKELATLDQDWRKAKDLVDRAHWKVALGDFAGARQDVDAGFRYAKGESDLGYQGARFGAEVYAAIAENDKAIQAYSKAIAGCVRQSQWNPSLQNYHHLSQLHTQRATVFERLGQVERSSWDRKAAQKAKHSARSALCNLSDYLSESWLEPDD